VTTNIIASQSFLKKYPGTVRALLQAVQYTNTWAKAKTAAAKDAVHAQLLKWSGKKFSDDVINRAWPSLTFTLDPVAAQLADSTFAAVEAGTLTNVGSRGIAGIYALRLLNQLMKFQKTKTYKAAGLGLV
jgi:NitT/TauT family transport system substrate-binding protein